MMMTMRVNDADGAVAELAASQHGAFTRSQAASHNLTSRAIRHRLDLHLLDEPYPGVLIVRGWPERFRQQAMAATLVRPGRAWASSLTAGALYGLDGRVGPSIPEVLVETRDRFTMPGIRVRRTAELPVCDRFQIGPIPVTGLARTLADLGSTLPRDALLRALDAARRQGASPLWLRATAERLHRPGQSGTGALLRLLDSSEAADRVPDSWFERLVERCIRIPGLPPPVLQHPIVDDAGRRLAVIDLAFPDVLYGIEAHSRQFHFGAGPESKDSERELEVTEQGWLLTYIGYHAVASTPERVAERTAKIVRRRQLQLLGP